MFKHKKMVQIGFNMRESDEFHTEEFDFNQTDFEYAMGQGQRYGRRTKEQEIYGIFAADSDDDERPSFHHGKKRPKDTAPVVFVSGGVKTGSKTQQADGTLTEEEEDVIFEAPPEKRSRTSFAQPTPSTSGLGSQVFAGMRSANFNAMAGTSDSGWFKAGKGSVIMQMMQKMGYEHGRGLGKSKQGIVEPVQAVARPGRGAVGAYGSEVKGPKFGESAAEAQARINNPLETQGIEAVPQTGNWKKSTVERKTKVHYKTMDDVINENEALRYSGLSGGINTNLGKIIDMTGPEKKVYQDFSSFSRRARIPIYDGERSKFNIPELTHNLITLLDFTEEEICKTDREIRHIKDQNEVLKHEEKRIADEIIENNEEILRLEEVEDLVRSFCSSLSTSLEELKKFFLVLRRDYGTEYTMYGLESIAIPVVLPKIKSYFSDWNPLDPEQIAYGFDMMKEWKEILGDTKGGALFKHFDQNSNPLSAFDHCVWHGWMPNMRKAAQEWSPRSNGPVMISLVQLWLQILPKWILENLLEQVLTPRIREHVDLWDPTSDIVPIDSWILPWHSIMGDRLLLVYACIRQKIAKGLRNWSPGDRSAIESIRPWVDVFSVGSMQTFLGMNIVPKLEKALRTIDLSSTEHFEYIELFDWMALIGDEVIGNILTTSFFPRYHDYLRRQLSSPILTMQELEKIKKNYMDWKNMLPQELLRQQAIMTELKRTLLLLGEAQNRLTGTSLPFPGGMHFQTAVPAPQPRMQFSVPPINTPFVQLPPTNFKQLVESTAISNGIQFFPQRSRFQEGKQVYMFGDYSIYIDGTMLYCYNPPKRQWMPASLKQLIEMSKG